MMNPAYNQVIAARDAERLEVFLAAAGRLGTAVENILHGLRTWHDRRGQLRHGGQRVSRHYYDIARLLQSPLGATAVTDRDLAIDCARHARMFFNSPDFDLDHAVPGTLTLTPSAAMLEPLQRDYDAMAGMIMGVAPPFGDVMDAVAALERQLNGSDGPQA